MPSFNFFDKAGKEWQGILPKHFIINGKKRIAHFY
jgi:prophage maintenance system killer protein